MENCLVTKLKGSVDADLLKLGEMRIKCSTAACGGTTTEAMRTITIRGKNDVVSAGGRTFKAKSGSNPSTPYQDVTEWTINADEDALIFPDGEYEISVLGKYNLGGFGAQNIQEYSDFFSINVEDLEFSVDRELLYIFGQKMSLHGKFKSHYISNVRGISFSNYFSPKSNIAYADLYEIFESNIAYPTLETISLFETRRSTGVPVYTEHSKGNIDNLIFPNLEQILINGTEITGDIDTMIQNMITAGRTSGNFYTQGNNFVTVKGTPFDTWRVSLPGAGQGVRFTIDPTAEDGWTAAKE